jgi:hypothetical protein
LLEQPEKPPFDFRTDLLLVGAIVPVEPLQAAFPQARLLKVAGRAVLLAWFSRVHESCYRDAAGRVVCTRAEGHGAYAELTVLVVLRNGDLFVPRIEASSALSERLARAYYGMPKVLVHAAVEQHGNRVLGWIDGSRLDGQRLGGGSFLGPIARATFPRVIWQAWFPSGGSARARIPRVERVELVRVRDARLAPHPPWLPRSPRLLQVGVLLQGVLMRLLPPEQEPASSRPRQI